jgi:peptide/nickel transport system permease protein
MFTYILRRVLLSIPVLLGVTVIVFLSLHLAPGDPVRMMVGPEAAISAEQMADLRQEYGFNDPLIVQYGRYLKGVLQGDLGRSIRSNKPVTAQLRDAFPSTLQLTLAATGMALLIGVPLGILAAIFRNSVVDGGSMVFAVLGISMPSFWLGLMLIFLFSLRLGWFPATGHEGLKPLILPALTLGVGEAAIVARMTRSGLVEVLGQDFVRTARAKGLREARIIWRHALKNALIPVVTIIGLQFGALLAGAVIVETVFSRPGVGQLTVNAILNRDFPTVQGAVLMFATIYLVVNLLVDLLYGYIDPRIRYGEA